MLEELVVLVSGRGRQRGLWGCVLTLSSWLRASATRPASKLRCSKVFELELASDWVQELTKFLARREEHGRGGEGGIATLHGDDVSGIVLVVPGCSGLP